jgi:negative regulator of sigma-B (phosphoserine phosphatase)
MRWASWVRPMPGQRVCGDAALIKSNDEYALLAMVDGLGHGTEAHRAAVAAHDYFSRRAGRDIIATLRGLHRALAKTPGAAVGLCRLDLADSQLEYAGIGNTSLCKVGRRETRMVSRDGVLGHNAGCPPVQRASIEPGDLILLHTDGVSTSVARANLLKGRALAPKTLAHRIVQHFGKPSDDAGCIVVRCIP